MRIFIDCTHTAIHTYKNTGIHRVVRQITSELSDLSANHPNLQVIPVMFDGSFIRRVTSLSEEDSLQDTQKSSESQLFQVIKKPVNRLKGLFNKIQNKIKKKFPVIFIKANKNPDVIRFDKVDFSSKDVYLVADANWDLPLSYYNFLEKLKSQNTQIVLICYDLIPIKFPDFCSKAFSNNFYDYYIRYSPLFDKVIGISKNSIEDFLEFKKKNQSLFPSNQTVTSFRLGSDYSNPNEYLQSDAQPDDPKITALLNERYILVVGSLSPHKNTKTIVQAFDLLVESQIENTHLVFAGNRGWHLETDYLIESNKMYKKLIHILDSVTDSQLRILYKNCYCLVQASFYEGFGLPVVEALQYYKPVISSTGGSLPEVGGDFCVYFDPHQPQELYQALKTLLSSDTYYEQWVNRLKTEYKPFSWQESAQQLLSHLCS